MQGPRNLKTALAAAVALALGASAAKAATITVTSVDDVFHSSTCNLRNAIASFRLGSAQGACAPVGTFGDNDTVAFAPALANSTITLARGQLTIAGTVTIIGSGQTIDAAYGSRVLYLNHATLIASSLTLTHGYAGGTGRGGSGAGIYIYSGNATLDSVTVSHNVALGDGGGINIEGGSLTLSRSTVSDNTSALSSGGISVYGAANISDSIISANTGARTGGIAIFSGYSYSTVSSNMSITRSTIANNHAACAGSPCTGGIYSGYKNFLTLGASTISGNSAAGAFDKVAGGMYLYDSALTLVDSTLAQNSAMGNNLVAGGIWHTGTNVGASTVTNATISANSATSYSAGSNVRSGILLGYGSGGTSNLQLRNCIIAGNANGSDVGAQGGSEGVTASLVGTSAGILPFIANDPSNQFTDTPGLGPLQGNGGPTQTMALLPGSVAIDGGKNAFVSTNYDQRGPGFPRVFNAAIDIGAVEFQGERIFANGFEPGP